MTHLEQYWGIYLMLFGGIILSVLFFTPWGQRQMEYMAIGHALRTGKIPPACPKQNKR